MLGLSQKELANKLNIHTSLISKWEKGDRVPTSEQLMDLSNILGLSVDFLMKSELKYNLKFRTKSVTKSKEAGEILKDLNQLIYYIVKSYEMLNQLPEKFNFFIKFNLQELNKLCSDVKEFFKLNRIITYSELKEALIEKNIHVFEWNMPLKISGISFRDEVSVIIINYSHTKERKIFTLAHELAHILFHLNETNINLTISDVGSVNKIEEKIANLFAAELLLPNDEIENLVTSYKDDIKNPFTLDTIAKYFNVSREAVFYRLAEKNIFNWKEKSKYFKKVVISENVHPNRVINIDEQVSKKFLMNALKLYLNEKITAGKLSEWLFVDRIILEEYLKDFTEPTSEILIIEGDS